MVRTITIRVAAHQTVRLRDNWQKAIQARVEAVSEIYEREFRIRWSIVDFGDWNANEFVLDACDLIDDLKVKVKPETGEIVLGVFGKPRKSAGGCTRLFSRTSVVLDPGEAAPGGSKDWYGSTHHTIGGGAWQLPSPDSS